MGSLLHEAAIKVKEAAAGMAGMQLSNDKIKQLEEHTVKPTSATTMTSMVGGVKIADTETSLTAGARGPALLSDFEFREKMTSFDHETIPERVVHARGTGAHGYFELYESQADITCAPILTDTSRRTPVFVRFSTVIGFRGSPDTVRDVRGFATRFYTPEGNWDLVGNNIPVFFVQDGIKFPDVVHAAKPEPHNEIPQAQTAHDNFWDFISLSPESTHMAMWVLSDRAIPRSYRTMAGFGVSTFTLVNDAGVRRFVKFIWRPVLGVHSLAWDEAQKLCGQDPDYHRRDLYDAIAAGNFPQYELGLQVIDAADEESFDFDILDDTKLIPEELVPIRYVGRMTLNRAPTEFFTEVEQVAFCVQNVVPGIGFSNDPMLQTRTFSYLDTQLRRFGGPNFTQLPINRPVCPVFNFTSNGPMRTTITDTKVNYWPNRFGTCPPTPRNQGAYGHSPERCGDVITRLNGPKFAEHFKQARMFYNSLSPAERQHLEAAAVFELGRCVDENVRQRMVNRFAHIDFALAGRLAAALGVKAPTEAPEEPPQPAARLPSPARSPALSQDPTVNPANAGAPATRRIAMLVADGFDATNAAAIAAAAQAAGAMLHVVGPRLGMIKPAGGGDALAADFTIWTCRSTYFDGIAFPGGAEAIRLLRTLGAARDFAVEAYKHCKPVCVMGDAVQLVADLPGALDAPSPPVGVWSRMGVVTYVPPAASTLGTGAATGGAVGAAVGAPAGAVAAAFKEQQAGKEHLAVLIEGGSAGDAAGAFIAALAQHRFWSREVSMIV